MMLLKRFNEYGLELFSNYITSLGSSDSPDPPPRGILTRPDTTHSIRPSVDVDLTSLDNRLDAAQKITALLAPLPDPVKSELEVDTGFWSWLSLYYFESVCPPNRGRRAPGKLERHVIDGKGRGKYRHLLASPYLIYKQIRPAYQIGMAVLNGPVDMPGEAVEQLTGRNDLIGNRAVVEAYTELYYDRSTETYKPGARGNGRGSCRRFGKVLLQLDRTFDLGSMPASKIKDLMPSEFDRYR